mmetsp:Transcript_59161/g.152156  ORF Transcript_59161/g.152156 Transcript_59161/m.152156 type:complete len:628 (+) Transcript_59161:1136-3019(+)
MEPDAVLVTWLPNLCVHLHERHVLYALGILMPRRQVIILVRDLDATLLLRLPLGLGARLDERLLLLLVDEAYVLRPTRDLPAELARGAEAWPLHERLRLRAGRDRVQRALAVPVEPDLEELPVVLAHRQRVAEDALGLLLHEAGLLPGAPRAADVVALQRRVRLLVRAARPPRDGALLRHVLLLLQLAAPQDVMAVGAGGAEGGDADDLRVEAGLAQLAQDLHPAPPRIVVAGGQQRAQVQHRAVEAPLHERASPGQAGEAVDRAQVAIDSLDGAQHHGLLVVPVGVLEHLRQRRPLDGVGQRVARCAHLHGVHDGHGHARVPCGPRHDVPQRRAARRRDAGARALGVHARAQDQGPDADGLPAGVLLQAGLLLRLGPGRRVVEFELSGDHALALVEAVRTLVEDARAAGWGDNPGGALHDRLEGVGDPLTAGREGDGLATLLAQAGDRRVQGGRARGVARVHANARPIAAEVVRQPVHHRRVARVRTRVLVDLRLAEHEVVELVLAAQARVDPDVGEFGVRTVEVGLLHASNMGLQEHACTVVEGRVLGRRDAKDPHIVVVLGLVAAVQHGQMPGVHLEVPGGRLVFGVVLVRVPLAAPRVRVALLGVVRQLLSGLADLRHDVLAL